MLISPACENCTTIEGWDKTAERLASLGIIRAWLKTPLNITAIWYGSWSAEAQLDPPACWKDVSLSDSWCTCFQFRITVNYRHVTPGWPAADAVADVSFFIFSTRLLCREWFLDIRIKLLEIIQCNLNFEL